MPRSQGGCGCCGCSGCLLLIALLFLFLGLGGVFFLATQFNNVVADHPTALPIVRLGGSSYPVVRQKLDTFLDGSSTRSLMLSEGELNTLIDDAPELQFLSRGAAVTLHNGEMQLNLSIPLRSIPGGTRYINAVVAGRPDIVDGQVRLNLIRMEQGGHPPDSGILSFYRQPAETYLNQLLTGWNQVLPGGSIRSLHVQDNLVTLAR
jgi:hypothetical protein